MPAAEIRRRLDAVGLEALEPSRYLEDLSIGERQLVEIARAHGRNARLFILDEPTATLNSADIAQRVRRRAPGDRAGLRRHLCLASPR